MPFFSLRLWTIDDLDCIQNLGMFVFGNGAESKSKRVSLKKKYKIIRKVKEHHKKKAKEAKKLGPRGRNKVEKDPGIPNDWPFKEEELKALEARRARAIEELELKKAVRKERVGRPFYYSSLFPFLFILFFNIFAFFFSPINRYYHFFVFSFHFFFKISVFIYFF